MNPATILAVAALVAVAGLGLLAAAWRLWDLRNGARLAAAAGHGTIRRVDRVEPHQLDDEVPTRLAIAWGDIDAGLLHQGSSGQ